jgi:hypothetical protein
MPGCKIISETKPNGCNIIVELMNKIIYHIYYIYITEPKTKQLGLCVGDTNINNILLISWRAVLVEAEAGVH